MVEMWEMWQNEYLSLAKMKLWKLPIIGYNDRNVVTERVSTLVLQLYLI